MSDAGKHPPATTGVPRSRSCGSAAPRRWRWAAPRRSPSIMSAAGSRSASASRAGRQGLVPGSRHAHGARQVRRRQAARRHAGALCDGPRQHRRPAGGGRRRGLHHPRRLELVGRSQEGRPGRLHRGPRRQLSHPAGQPDRRRGRQRHLDQPARPCGVSRRARLRALGRAAGQGAGGVRGAGHRRRRSGRPRDPLALVGDGRTAPARSSPPVRRWSSARSARRSPRRISAAPHIAVDHAGTIDNRVDERGGVLRRDPPLPVLHAVERVGAPPAVACDRSGRSLRRGAAVASCRRTGASPTTCAS